MDIVAHLEHIREETWKSVIEATRNRDSANVARWNEVVAKCEALLLEARTLEEKVKSFEASHEFEIVTEHVAHVANLSKEVPSARVVGSQIRNDWVKRLEQEHLITLTGHSKRYETVKRVSVGIAFANELKGLPKRWFLGLPDEPLAIIVLLCQSYQSKLYDLVIPVDELGDAWDYLSRSKGQIKFNVKESNNEMLLLVPRRQSKVVTQYIGNYSPLR